MATGNDSREFVQSLARGLAVIRSFGPEHPEMTLTEVAQQTGMTRAAARRFLHTLEELGFVGSNGKQYSLRPQVLCLGYAYLSSMAWWQVAQPYMEDVAATVHESCSASVLDGTDIVYVARIPTTRIMTINLALGSRLPAFATSMGRVLLAHLSPSALDDFFAKAELTKLTDKTVADEAELRRIVAQAYKQGYSVVDQELETGLRSLAVPIFDRAGNAIAAMNVGGHASRTSRKDMIGTVLPVLHAAAERITSALVN